MKRLFTIFLICCLISSCFSVFRVDGAPDATKTKDEVLEVSLIQKKDINPGKVLVVDDDDVKKRSKPHGNGIQISAFCRMKQEPPVFKNEGGSFLRDGETRFDRDHYDCSNFFVKPLKVKQASFSALSV